jgi:hypothetical protein
MIVNFFRSLEAERVEYLLISGQAAILYGAAVFSEDIDLWIRPTEDNLAKLVAALRQNNARYYKLTPPLVFAHASQGHGFHFWLPAEGGFYLDLMGAPPRVGSFQKAFHQSNQMETEWGRLPVVNIPDLVELKKTQRLEDYPVISRLVLEFVHRFGGTVSNELIDWAIDNLFTLESLVELIRNSGLKDSNYTGRYEKEVDTVREELSSSRGLSEHLERELTNWMQRRLAECQAEDREYWKPVIGALRRLRAEGRLVPEGQAV